MTKGEIIRQAREAAQMTQGELARIAHTTKQTIYKYEQGIVTNIPWERVEAIASALGISSAYIMGWTEYPGIHTRKVPRIGSIACGEPILAEQNFEGYDDVPDFVKCDFTLIARGNSMNNARILDGDIVCVKAQQTASDGQIVVASIDGLGDAYEATLKRIRFMADGTVLLCPDSTDPSFVPLLITRDKLNCLHVQGVATHFISTIK